MNPFMRTFTEPSFACWHNSLLAPNGCVYMMPREERDWTVPFVQFAARLSGKQFQPRIVGYDLFAHPDSWAELGARHLASAYRPEGVP